MKTSPLTKLKWLGLAAISSAVLLTGCASTEQTQPLTNEEKAIAVLDSLGTTNQAPLKYISDEQYIQHNQSAPSGKAGLLSFLSNYPKVEVKESNVVRSFTDRNYVIVHSHVKGFDGVVFDIFRFDDGLMVEHWDAIQPSTKPNESGHTMYDGTTKIADLSKTTENKALVKEMIDTLFVKGEFGKASQYISEDTYIQHNPWFGDGLDTLLQGFSAMAAQGQTLQYYQVHAILGQGNFVLSVSEGELNGTHTAFYDLFRVEDGKVVEHWDVLQNVPPFEQRKNSNGMFNFPASAMQ
ncbi:nuclear transport factor 2 family protein [Marinomonas balearica]|nr:nuclear transport factor 2 family protein [Marinomonas balearica]